MKWSEMKLNEEKFKKPLLNLKEQKLKKRKTDIKYHINIEEFKDEKEKKDFN